MTPRARQVLECLGRDDAEALTAHLRRQRWFGGRSREPLHVRPVEIVPLREDCEPAVWSVLVRVTYAEGDDDGYHLLLSGRPAAATDPDRDERLVAVTDDGVAVRDALYDGAALAALWTAIAAGETHAGAHGEVRCRNLRMGPAGTVDPGGIGVLEREQSNTSAVRENRELLKCLRRVAPGASPELELSDALARAGFERLAAPLGAVEYHPTGGGDPTLLAVVQPFLADATEGWALALATLRDAYAGATQPPRHGAAPAPGPRVDAFAPEAAMLGRVTGEMHLAALRIGPEPYLRAHPADQPVLSAWADEMTSELDALLARTGRELASLRARRDRLAGVFDGVRRVQGGMAVRIHGDYHLGQVLRTGDGWTVIDFEGEPDLPLRERRRHSCPLRDVAGMLRSFDYAAAAALAERVHPADPRWAGLEPVGHAWAAAARDAFWAAYTRAVDGSGLLPGGAGAVPLLRAFELRKAVYEVGYELGHRRDWVGIPLRFLEAATGDERPG